MYEKKCSKWFEKHFGKMVKTYGYGDKNQFYKRKLYKTK